jgi:DNA-binding NarL/FixJ family response regulator
MTKILIVDDHAIVRRGLIRILEEDFDVAVVVDEAASGREAVKKALVNDYSLVLLDISLPDMNGLDVLRKLKQERPQIQVLILTMHPEEQYAIRALRVGAGGYLTKQSAPDELITAVRKVLLGGRYVSSVLAERLVFELGNFDDPEGISHKILSDREFRVFCELASGKTIKEIADQLCLSIKTVSTYRTRILNKMKMKNNAEIITYAIKHGFVD